MSDEPVDLSTIGSAARLGEILGARVPPASSVSAAAIDLATAARDLLDAVVATDVDDDRRREVAETLRDLAAALRERRREPLVVLVREPDGRVNNLTQAGSGPLNPRAPALRFAPFPPPPAAGMPWRPVEIEGRCTLDASFGGGPGRAHGGVVATLFDEALGRANLAAGLTGMTVALDVRFRAGTPLGVPLRVTARCAHVEGRKRFCAGKLRHEDTLVAEAIGVYVAERAPEPAPGR
ncbi:MAG: PaaI family thioesterase [Actinomycetota bacterium]